MAAIGTRGGTATKMSNMELLLLSVVVVNVVAGAFVFWTLCRVRKLWVTALREREAASQELSEALGAIDAWWESVPVDLKRQMLRDYPALGHRFSENRIVH